MRKKKSVSLSFVLLIAVSHVSVSGQTATHGLFAAFNRYANASQAALGVSLLSSGSASVLLLNPAGMQYLLDTHYGRKIHQSK
jgi:hypothetical protein